MPHATSICGAARPGFLASALPVLLLTVVAPAAIPPLPDHLDIAAIDAHLAGYAQELQPAGLSIAIVQEGRLVLAKGYGLSAPDRPVETNTLFAIGSVTKQFTSACILLLAEDGKLSVHDPVAKYYPTLTRAQDITLPSTSLLPRILASRAVTSPSPWVPWNQTPRKPKVGSAPRGASTPLPQIWPNGTWG